MLKWFVNDEVAIQVQRNKVLIEEEQVELSLVENVDVEHFFCNDAWLLVQEVVALKDKINQCLSILCKHCSHDVHEFASLAGDQPHINCFVEDCHDSPMCQSLMWLHSYNIILIISNAPRCPVFLVFCEV